MKDLTLVGLGEVLWDVLPSGKQLGGAPTNFAHHAQCLGGRGVVVSRVGDDTLGAEILDRLDALGLDRRFVGIDSDHPTGTVTVHLDQAGQPDYTIHENVAWDFITAGDGVLELAKQVDGVCYGSLCQRSSASRDSIRKFLEATADNCIRVFDVNLRQHYFTAQVIADMLELSNVFKLNNEELPVVAKMLGASDSEDEFFSELTDRFSLELIVLTKGSGGSELYSRGKKSVHDGFQVEPIDTVGAGDAFTAAVTMGLLTGESLDEINDRANRLASFVCTQNGATPKLPADF